MLTRLYICYYLICMTVPLNWQISPLSLERMTEILRKTIDQSAYFQTSQKSLKDACFVKSLVFWIPIYQSNNVDLEKVKDHSIAC